MMRLLAVAIVLLSATTVLAEETQQEQKSLPLHEHPTLVKMFEQSNALRAAQGLPPHRMSPRLTEAAQDHARFMARTGVFDHYANGGHIQRAHKYGYNGMVRENIAMGMRTIHQTFNAWRNSGGHWAAIVSDTSDAGFGYAIADNGTQYWVGVYGYGSQESAAE